MAPISPALRAALSELPSVTALLASPQLADLPHGLVVDGAREVLDGLRRDLRGGALDPTQAPDPSGVVRRVADWVRARRQRRLRRVINATGVVLHTNLGRAPLAPEVAQAVLEVAQGYANVELDLETGRRGGRLTGVEAPLRALTGAERVIAVNNNAAAVLLVLTALGRHREVVVSRGELVEIGGSFRVPDVISAGGARLVEVGATNRTRAADFEAAVTPDTAMLLRVHPSNFRQVGFVERPDRAELVAVARRQGVPLVEDLGSGLIGPVPVEGMGLEGERVERALEAGVDLVCFSGDKLLGGPQAGIIAGRADLVERLRRHPLYRALRLDKLGLVALEATVRMYLDGRQDEVPTRAMLQARPDTLEAAAHQLARQLPGSRVVRDVGVTGGGALPGRGLASWVVRLPDRSADVLAWALRTGDPAVVARVTDGAVQLDPRTVQPSEHADLVAAVVAARSRAAREAASPSSGPADSGTLG